ncbi:ATP-dependent RNA helicase HrpA [Ahniella affigens]|nr:ATP-dependent RNA helicase HrpA [Ahniella affigens]
MSVIESSADTSLDWPKLRARLDRTMLSDRHVLRREADRLAANPSADAATVARFLTRLNESEQRFAARAERLPNVEIDAQLPISHHADEIVRLIQKERVIVLAGETGSGKTTQLPKLCLAAGRGVAGMIACTQPRRVAARSVARRVAEEIGTQVGQLVGFQVRFTDQVSEHSLIKFMTDGILLAETEHDPWLNRYDTIIIDEAHERSLNIDFLLGFLNQLIPKRPDLKLIITSATIDTQRFAKHFFNAPIVQVEGRSYPVEIRYRAPVETRDEGRGQALIQTLDEITRQDGLGDVLVFLPGEREIRDAHRQIEQRKYRETEVLALYARLSSKEQDRVFHPGPKRRIVLATNVAETSLTVPRIRYVVDTGVARISRYSHRHKVQRLHIEPISQASLNQRAGRCGRVGPGICYRLFGADEFLQRPEFTEPEILRSSLANVILRMLSLKLSEVERFPFVERPEERALAEGFQTLTELGLISADRRKLTPHGRIAARIPIDVKLARVLIAANERGALAEGLIIASFLSIQDPRERPAEARQAADQAHLQWADPQSDFLSAVNLWRAYDSAHQELTQSKLRDWCERQFLNFLRMREWRELHRQLLLIVEELGWRLGDHAATFEALHQSLLFGFPAMIGRKDEKGLYQGTRGRKFAIFPGSALSKKPPYWLLTAAILDIQKVYAMTNARVESEWIIDAAGPLLKRNYLDPRWDRQRGQVMADEQISLFGLILVERRPVHYGGIEPQAARDLFLNNAMPELQLDSRSNLIQKARQVLVRARAEEAKQRREGLLIDEAARAEWWRLRLPEDICTTNALDRYLAKIDAETEAGLLWTLDQVLATDAALEEQFPNSLRFGPERFRLSYAFDTQAESDGVTLSLPLNWLNALPESPLAWLVPGLLRDKVTELIRGLPKPLRRNFVPAPDFAKAFVESQPNREHDLFDTLTGFLKRVTGVDVARDHWLQADTELPKHLRMRVQLLDEQGRNLAHSRDIGALKQQYSERARQAFASRAAKEYAETDVRSLPTEPVPESVRTKSGLTAYPALVDRGNRVDWQVFEQAEMARTEHRQGVHRLLRFALEPEVTKLRKQLPLAPKLALAYTPIGSPEQLRDEVLLGSLDDLLTADTGTSRSADSLQLSEQAIRKAWFPSAVKRLSQVEAALAAYAELLPKMKPPLLGFATANYDDLKKQLSGLIHSGFARDLPSQRLADLPRYLKAMRQRIERLLVDPRKDQSRMLIVQAFVAQLPEPRHPEYERLRWLLEEFRVQTFAQELGTSEPVSEKRIQRLFEQVRG